MTGILLNNEDVTGQRLTLKREQNRGSAAWVNGQRLKPGDVLTINGVILHIEPPLDFTDACWHEDEPHNTNPTRTDP